MACPLTHASPSDIEEVEIFKAELRSWGIEVLEFLGLENGNARDVWDHDIGCVDSCDLLVAICNNPSTGLGIEIARQAMYKGGPVLAVAHKDAKVTRMILDPRLDDFVFVRYNYLITDVVPLVQERHSSFMQGLL